VRAGRCLYSSRVVIAVAIVEVTHIIVIGFWIKKKILPPVDSEQHQKLLTPPLLKLIIQGVYNLDRLLGGSGSGGGGLNRVATAATLLLDRATMPAASDICGARKYKTKINTHAHTRVRIFTYTLKNKKHKINK